MWDARHKILNPFYWADSTSIEISQVRWNFLFLFQDYPSISQLAYKITESKVNVIFAVTSDRVKIYQDLSQFIEGSTVGKLANDSSNIVELVQDNYSVSRDKTFNSVFDECDGQLTPCIQIHSLISGIFIDSIFNNVVFYFCRKSPQRSHWRRREMMVLTSPSAASVLGQFCFSFYRN